MHNFALYLLFGLLVSNVVQADSKTPTYFQFTRGCIEAIERGNSDKAAACLTFIWGSFAVDVMLSPFQMTAQLANALDQPAQDKSSSSSSSSTSEKKHSNGPEIPEEKKAKISLFMLVADDARDYLFTGVATPLLASAVSVLRVQYPEFNGNPDFTVESNSILDLEFKLLQFMNREDQ
jgi:hypothetical protein